MYFLSFQESENVIQCGSDHFFEIRSTAVAPGGLILVGMKKLRVVTTVVLKYFQKLLLFTLDVCILFTCRKFSDRNHTASSLKAYLIQRDEFKFWVYAIQRKSGIFTLPQQG